MKHISEIIEDIESAGTLPGHDKDVKSYNLHCSHKYRAKKKAAKAKESEKRKALIAICKMRGIER